jgi:hypothetical protein
MHAHLPKYAATTAATAIRVYPEIIRISKLPTAEKKIKNKKMGETCMVKIISYTRY